jgi:hypothetical protein
MSVRMSGATTSYYGNVRKTDQRDSHWQGVITRFNVYSPGPDVKRARTSENKHYYHLSSSRPDNVTTSRSVSMMKIKEGGE